MCEEIRSYYWCGDVSDDEFLQKILPETHVQLEFQMAIGFNDAVVGSTEMEICGSAAIP